MPFNNITFKDSGQDQVGQASGTTTGAASEAVAEQLRALTDRTGKIERMLGLLLEHAKIEHSEFNSLQSDSDKDSVMSMTPLPCNGNGLLTGALLPALSHQTQQGLGTTGANSVQTAKIPLVLSGQEAGELHFDCMGTYQELDIMVGGRKVYQLDSNQDKFLYFCDTHGSWYLYTNAAMKAGLATGWIRCDSTSSPHSASAQWFVGDGSEWIEISKIKATCHIGGQAKKPEKLPGP